MVPQRTTLISLIHRFTRVDKESYSISAASPNSFAIIKDRRKRDFH